MAPRTSLCPVPCLRLTPLLPGSKAAVPGSLEGGAAAGTAPLRTPLLTYLILPLAPGAGRTQLQPSTQGCPADRSQPSKWSFLARPVL